jgi:hypothetical protein
MAKYLVSTIAEPAKTGFYAVGVPPARISTDPAAIPERLENIASRSNFAAETRIHHGRFNL